MQIGIVTFWNSTDNYGQILQYFALQSYLSSIGHEPFLIRYLPPSVAPAHKPRPFLTQIGKLFKVQYLKYFFINIWDKIYFPIVNKFIINHNQNRNFQCFRENYFIKSEIYSYDNLKSNPPKADVYACGSDQIWSGAGSDDIYFLNFGASNIKRISISASFGRTYNSLSQIERTRLIALLQKFNHITIREQAGVEICHNLGRRDAQLICDPTLLNDVDIYTKLFKHDNIVSSEIFVYYLSHKTQITDFEIHRFFKKKNKTINYVASQGLVNRLPKIFPSIENWLYNIYSADFVVTNSFHGTVFSVLFRKNFATIALKSTNANTRIYTFLNMLGLENRICSSIDQLEEVYNTQIDYSKVIPKLNKFIENSRELISSILNEK